MKWGLLSFGGFRLQQSSPKSVDSPYNHSDTELAPHVHVAHVAHVALVAWCKGDHKEVMTVKHRFNDTGEKRYPVRRSAPMTKKRYWTYGGQNGVASREMCFSSESSSDDVRMQKPLHVFYGVPKQMPSRHPESFATLFRIRCPRHMSSCPRHVPARHAPGQCANHGSRSSASSAPNRGSAKHLETVDEGDGRRGVGWDEEFHVQADQGCQNQERF